MWFNNTTQLTTVNYLQSLNCTRIYTFAVFQVFKANNFWSHFSKIEAIYFFFWTISHRQESFFELRTHFQHFHWNSLRVVDSCRYFCNRNQNKLKTIMINMIFMKTKLWFMIFSKNSRRVHSKKCQLTENGWKWELIEY